MRNPAVNGSRAGARSRAALARACRQESQEQGRAAARRGDIRHAAGCMLYWAEGSRSRNAMYFTNSDPAMVRFFVEYLRICHEVPDDALRIDINLFADHVSDQQRIESFWVETLGVPRSCLRKSTVNVYSKYSKRRRRNRLPYGTCRVAVYSTPLVRSIYGAIQEYGGFDRPEWLD